MGLRGPRNSHELTGHPPSFPVSPYSPSESESDSEAEHVLRAAPRRLSPAKNWEPRGVGGQRAGAPPSLLLRFPPRRGQEAPTSIRSSPPEAEDLGRGGEPRGPASPPRPTSYSHLLARSRGLLTVTPHRYLLHPAGRRRGGGIKWLELGTWARVYTLEKGRRLLEQTDGEEAADGEMIKHPHQQGEPSQNKLQRLVPCNLFLTEHIAKSKSQISLDVAVCCQSKSIRTRIIEREMEEAYIAMALLSQQQPWTSNSSATRPPLCPALRAGAQD
ncbi:hypothetical protein U9M48_004872, partial [Paspalum notatum var. saurae]